MRTLSLSLSLSLAHERARPRLSSETLSRIVSQRESRKRPRGTALRASILSSLKPETQRSQALGAGDWNARQWSSIGLAIERSSAVARSVPRIELPSQDTALTAYAQRSSSLSLSLSRDRHEVSRLFFFQRQLSLKKFKRENPLQSSRIHFDRFKQVAKALETVRRYVRPMLQRT